MINCEIYIIIIIMDLFQRHVTGLKTGQGCK